MIGNEKHNTENIDYFYAKFDNFYPLKSFLPLGNLWMKKKINFCYLDSNKLQNMKKKKKKKKIFWKSWFYSSKFWFLPPENFFDHLNSCKCKIKSVFYFHSRKLQQEVKKTALKLDAFTKIELYSLKLQFLLPWNHIFPQKLW